MGSGAGLSVTEEERVPLPGPKRIGGSNWRRKPTERQSHALENGREQSDLQEKNIGTQWGQQLLLPLGKGQV